MFGVLKDDNFEDGKCFEFSLSDICELFCGLFYIVKGFTKSDCENEGSLCKKSNEVSYVWRIENVNDETVIILTNKNCETITSQLSLTIPEFNDAVYLLANLILPCLNLKEKEFKIFQLILTLDLEQILKFKNDTLIHSFLNRKDGAFDLTSIEVHSISILIYYHLDLLVAIHNLKSLYNPGLNITHQNINMMLSCH